MIVSKDKNGEMTVEVNLPSAVIGNANHDAFDKESLSMNPKGRWNL